MLTIGGRSRYTVPLYRIYHCIRWLRKLQSIFYKSSDYRWEPRSNKIHAFANLVVDDQIFLQLNSQINLDPDGDNLWGKFSWHMTFNTILAQTMLADCIGQFPWKQRETSIPFPSNWYLLWKWECYFFTAEKIDSSSNI